MIERGGDVVIGMLANVQQVTLKALIQATITPGTLVYSDGYDIYSRLEAWGDDQTADPSCDHAGHSGLYR